MAFHKEESFATEDLPIIETASSFSCLEERGFGVLRIHQELLHIQAMVMADVASKELVNRMGASLDTSSDSLLPSLVRELRIEELCCIFDAT